MAWRRQLSEQMWIAVHCGCAQKVFSRDSQLTTRLNSFLSLKIAIKNFEKKLQGKPREENSESFPMMWRRKNPKIIFIPFFTVKKFSDDRRTKFSFNDSTFSDVPSENSTFGCCELWDDFCILCVIYSRTQKKPDLLHFIQLNSLTTLTRICGNFSSEPHYFIISTHFSRQFRSELTIKDM